MKRSLVALFFLIGLGCGCQVLAAEPSRVPAVPVKTSVAPAKPESAKSASDTVAKPATAPQPWPQEVSDLKADPKAVFGRLDNGLRYVILPSKAPGRAALQLYMRVGSLMEAEDQRGMAHFLEHMAFNGTKRFPAGQMVEYFQRLGMSFGAHTNAHTIFDQTVFKLDLPRTSEDQTGESIKLFRDFLDGMLLEQKEIDRERRVIFSEMLARNSVELRAAVASLESTLPGTLVPERLPIGKTEALQAMTRQRFVDFYETWYTPGRATIVAVGNFDVPMVERLIKQNFADAKARRGEHADPNFGTVEPTRGVTAKVQVDAEAKAVAIEFIKVAPDPRTPDSSAKRRGDVVVMIADGMLNSRFSKLAARADSPFQSATASSEQSLNLSASNQIAATCQPAQWQSALESVEQELRRSVTYGFSDAEFADSKGKILALIQGIAEQQESLPSHQVAAAIVSSLVKSEVVTAAADDLALSKRILAEVTKGECEAAFRKVWQSPDVSILVKGNLPAPAVSSDAVLAAYRQSRSTNVAAPGQDKVAPFAYADFGPAGRIVKRDELKDLGIIQTTFANNVRVNVKRTDRQKDTVQVQIRFGGGGLEVPADNGALATLANSVFIAGGLEKHSLNELNRALAGRNWGLAFLVTEDAFQLGGASSAAELETELDVATAYLKAPGFRPESLPQFLNQADSLYAAAAHTPEAKFANDVMAFLHGDDSRFGLPPREALRKLTLDDLKAWLKQPLESGYMEVAIVGDIDPERALQLAAKTLGTLPPRDAAKPRFASRRQVKFPLGIKAKEFPVAADTPRAISLVAWPVLESPSIPRARRLGLLGDVLNDRLRVKVRQELGATYTPVTIVSTSEVFDNYGFIGVVLIVDPKQLPEIGPLVVKMAAELADGKIGDDEFERANKPFLSSIDDLDNGYWIGVAGCCQERPEVIDIARGRKADNLSIKKSEIEALAKTYLSSDQATLISVAPVARGPVALGK